MDEKKKRKCQHWDECGVRFDGPDRSETRPVECRTGRFETEVPRTFACRADDAELESEGE
ncbi:hypothetical protein LCGC14_2579380 [marine sediment metagenome]|uniref:Uncharacterized protein n=1 Tax=marine sediment metagenome TaxID=412755 RepID=A0A0F9D7L0_9ZZZZ